MWGSQLTHRSLSKIRVALATFEGKIKFLFRKPLRGDCRKRAQEIRLEIRTAVPAVSLLTSKVSVSRPASQSPQPRPHLMSAPIESRESILIMF